MDWLKRIHDTLDYIEDNLTDDIDFGNISKIALCSSYDFQKMFSYITGITLVEYIRRRRLTLAAFELRDSNLKIIDIALKYGYTSPVSFTRAFHRLHGTTPSSVRSGNVVLRAYPRMSFYISFKGDVDMKYRIEKKEEFDIFGIETIVDLGSNKMQSPSNLWKKCHEDGSYDKLFSHAGELPPFISQNLCKVHGAVNYRETEGDTFPYMIFSFESDSSKTEGYTRIHIPQQTYAIFTSDDFNWDDDLMNILATLEKRFYAEWLPTSNFEKVMGPHFEIYGGTPERGYIELWYPVAEK